MHNDALSTLVIYVAALFFLITGSLTISFIKCHSKASKQGYECSWGPIQGCMVKLKDGTWVDYSRLRIME